VLVDGDAPAVVGDAHSPVGQQRHVDSSARARHRLVDRVVDDFPHEMVKARGTRAPDVHARALAYGIEALEYLDVLGGVVAACGSGHAVHRT